MQPDVTQPILELIRFASTDLPPDVETALKGALEREEPGSAAHGALQDREVLPDPVDVQGLDHAAAYDAGVPTKRS